MTDSHTPRHERQPKPVTLAPMLPGRPRKLTFTEALHFLEEVYGLNALDHYVHSIGFEVPLSGVPHRQVQQEIDSFIASLADEIDTDSITIKPDSVDEPHFDIITLTIRVGA